MSNEFRIQKELLNELVSEVFKSIESALAKVSGELVKIKESLISRDTFDQELVSLKSEIENKISISDSKISALEQALHNQKLIIEAIQTQVTEFHYQPGAVGSGGAIPKLEKKLIVVGDSLVKHLDLKKIFPDGDNLLICLPGARIGTIRRKIQKMAAIYDADHIIIVVGANHNSEDSIVLATKIKFLLKESKELFPHSKLHYSAYLPKFSDALIPFVTDFNYRMKKICWGIGVDLIYNSQFIQNGKADQTLLARDGLHLSRKGVATLGSNMKYRVLSYSPRAPWSLKPLCVYPAVLTPDSSASPTGFEQVIDGKYVRPAVPTVSDANAVKQRDHLQRLLLIKIYIQMVDRWKIYILHLLI